MNHELLVKFNDNKQAVYHVDIHCKVRDAIESIEDETNKKIIAFKWLRIQKEWKKVNEL